VVILTPEDDLDSGSLGRTITVEDLTGLGDPRLTAAAAPWNGSWISGERQKSIN